MPSAEAISTPMDWEEAGRAWGARSTDWAYLFEPYARPANEVIFDQLGIGEGARLLDIACGSGFAAQIAARRGRPLGPRHPGRRVRPVLRSAAGGDRALAHSRCRDPDCIRARLDHRRTPHQ